MPGIHDRGFCPRCLLSELPGGEALARQVGEWIDALPPERRAPEDLREARLDICRRCGYLSGGTCDFCGCYADFRAARRDAACPDVPARWAAEEPVQAKPSHDQEAHS